MMSQSREWAGAKLLSHFHSKHPEGGPDKDEDDEVRKSTFIYTPQSASQQNNKCKRFISVFSRFLKRLTSPFGAPESLR